MSYPKDKMGLQLHLGDVILCDKKLRRITGITKDNFLIVETLKGSPTGLDHPKCVIAYEYLPTTKNEIELFANDIEKYNNEIVLKKYLQKKGF